MEGYLVYRDMYEDDLRQMYENDKRRIEQYHKEADIQLWQETLDILCEQKRQLDLLFLHTPYKDRLSQILERHELILKNLFILRRSALA